MIVYDSLDDLTRLVEGFAACTLPCHEWTHQAHLIVGLWHCSQHDAVEATDILRERIKRYNVSCGKQNTESSGYHETITCFFVWYIKRYLNNVDPQRSLVELVNDFCAHHVESSSPLKYYSQERLMSVAARLGWVEPDLRALD
ncbi:MAG: hypothetical protein JNM09_17830 [Blastocatellia bacterium]|nr:hypothetical protein [Blastocatellia bacterium]